MIKNSKFENEEIDDPDKNVEKKINFPENLIHKEFSSMEKWIFLIQNNEFTKNTPKSKIFK